MEFKDTALAYHPLVVKAFDVAKESHGGQKRGTTSGLAIAYMNHPVKVAEILQKTIPDCPPELIAAGLAHDLLEDTGMTEDRLRSLLGDEVTGLVKTVSLDPALKGTARVEFQQNSLSGESLNARRLKVADRLANLLSLTYDPPAHWTAVNKYDYWAASKALIGTLNVPDPELKAMADKILSLSGRAVFLAVRDRVAEKGFSSKHWKHATPALQDMMKDAAEEIGRKKDLFDSEGRPRQKASGLEDMYDHAALAHGELADVVNYLQLFTGCEAVVPDELKRIDRAKDVIKTRLDGNHRGINDIARVTVVCKNMQEVGYALHALLQSYQVAEIYDRFRNPLPTAYRDARVVLCSDDGHFCEVQIHLRDLWEAKKNEGDAIYARMRELIGKKELSGEKLTPEENKEKRALYDASRTLYKAAAEKHGFTDHKPSKSVAFRPMRGARLSPEFIRDMAGNQGMQLTMA